MGLFSLSNKTILITGASSGIGRSCAVQCSKMGASLLLMGRNVDELNRTVSELQPGTKVEMIVADFSKMVDLE